MSGLDILNNIVHKATILWGLEESSVELIRDVMNPVYRCRSILGEKVIIRLAEDARRSKDDILAEIEWVDYLNKHDSCFCRFFPNKAGNKVETITHDQHSYHVSCFYFQEGKPQILTSDPGWNNSLFSDIGGLSAKLHRYTKNFSPKHARHHWYDEEVFKNRADFESSVPAPVLDAIWKHLSKLKNISTEIDYHLVHADIKQDNYFYLDSGQLFLYDFDQSCVCWRIYDLVVSLYFNFCYGLCRIQGATDSDVKNYIARYIEGYSREGNFNERQLSLIPDLLILREALIYLIVKNIDHKLTTVNNKAMTTSIEEAYQEMEARLVSGEPYLQFDVTKI